jgi:glycosyltransferase involved in cell wall biosynthesis
MVKNKDFIVFGEDFGRYAHSLEHMMRPFFPENRILWVETAGMRGPRFNLYDFKRALSKIKSWNKKTSPTPYPNLKIISPFMLPFHGLKWVRMFNRWSVGRAVQKQIEILKFQHPIFLTTIPTNADFATLWKTDHVVYYCVDEFSLWPGFPHKTIAKREAELIQKCDIILATSKELQKNKSQLGKPAHFFPHGVDLEHFRLPVGRLPLSDLRSPLILGFFGIIDERVDLSLLKKILLSDCSIKIKLIGLRRVQSPLFEHPRVILQDAVPYSELPKHIEDVDIFLLPYVKNELTRNINPLKLREYLATGRPVVSTSLPEATQVSEGVYFATKLRALYKFYRH